MKKARPSTALQVGGLLLLAAVLTVTAYAHIHTVVTGYIDIVHYYESARALLEAATPTAFLHALLRWAPLFPALFALVLRWGGPSAVYFINPPLVALLITGLGVWTWRLRRDFAAAVLTVLLAAILFLTSQGRVSVYMLYPFREPLSFLFIWAGLLLALAAGRANGRRADLEWVLSGCAYVLAAAVREPSIFALSGAIAYALAQSRTPWPRRWRHAALTAAPFLAAACGLVLLAGLTGITGTAQLSGWRNMTADLTWDAWQTMLFRYLHWWRIMCGWPGLVLAGLGLAYLWRTRETAWWLLVPPLLITLGFYAGFAVSSRYALSSAIYLVPLAALGARWTVHGLARALRRGQPWVERGLLAILAGGLLFHAFQGMLRVDPRERVSRPDMSRFRAALATYVPPGRLVTTEYRARHLIDALTTQLALPQTGAPHFIAEVARHGAGYFLKPLTPASLSQAKVPFPNIAFEERIRQQLDIHPVTDARNQPVTMSLGPGAYALLRVSPWQAVSVTQDLTAAHCA
ncbi:MAG: hypothetical protein K9N49_04200, partial [Candidatus Marinimicrobia bacterium]|nr:hypothetical protein [Candidatus Neomarinimicrobiota bacterium]